MLRNTILTIALLSMFPDEVRSDTVLAARTFGLYDSSSPASADGTLGYYETGRIPFQSDNRSFFTFDLSQIDGPITGATLRLFNPRYGFVSSNPSETLQLFDVATPVSQLESAAGGVEVFSDLGSGVGYGSRVFTPSDAGQFVDIPLTPAAVNALNAAPGLFALGADLEAPVGGSIFARSYDRGVAALLLEGPSSYGTDLHATDSHPQASYLHFEFFFGDPRTEGVLIADLTPLPLAGTQYAEVELDASGNGTIRFAGGRFVLDDASDVLVNAGPLGTLRLSTDGLGLSIRTDAIAVEGFQFSLDDALNPEIHLNTGTFSLTDPTGPIVNLFPNEFPAVADFDEFSNTFQPTDLYGSGLAGTVDLGAGHFSEHGEINLSVPGSVISLSAVAGGLPVFVRVSGQIHVATVPEPSGLVLMAGGIACGIMCWNFKRIRTAV